MIAPHAILAKDETHPIPDVDVCDIQGERKDGGRDLVIVVARPMKADERSQRRLVEKIRGYLAFLSGLGPASVGARSRILVRIHADSDLAIFELLERSRAWVEDNHASLEVEKNA